MYMNNLNLFSHPDPAYAALAQAADARQREARAPGTWANMRTTVAAYERHCKRYRISPLAPTPLDVRCWLEELAGHLCPSSIANSASHLRLHFRMAEVSTQPLDHITVRMALDAMRRSKAHTPRPSTNVPIPIMKKAVRHLQHTPEGRVVATAVIIMFFSGARQSEVAPRSAATFDPTRHTTRGDVAMAGGHLHIHQKWAKNMQATHQFRDRRLAPTDDPHFCPVTSYRQMIHEAPTTSPRQPLLVFPSDGVTLAIPYLARQWTLAQKATGVQTPYTLHAIRKAAATVAFASGSSELEVQRFGGWASNAHRQYISTRDSHKVNRALIRATQQQHD